MKTLGLEDGCSDWLKYMVLSIVAFSLAHRASQRYVPELAVEKFSIVKSSLWSPPLDFFAARESSHYNQHTKTTSWAGTSEGRPEDRKIPRSTVMSL